MRLGTRHSTGIDHICNTYEKGRSKVNVERPPGFTDQAKVPGLVPASVSGIKEDLGLKSGGPSCHVHR